MADGSKADGLGLTVSYVESLINGKKNVVNRISQPTGGDIYLFRTETGTLIIGASIGGGSGPPQKFGQGGPGGPCPC